MARGLGFRSGGGDKKWGRKRELEFGDGFTLLAFVRSSSPPRGVCVFFFPLWGRRSVSTGAGDTWRARIKRGGSPCRLLVAVGSGPSRAQQGDPPQRPNGLSSCCPPAPTAVHWD